MPLSISAARPAAAALLAAAALGGCGDGGNGSGGGGGGTSKPLSAADVQRLKEIDERLSEYCGERKANGADESQEVPSGTLDEVDDLISLHEDHFDESFTEDNGETTTMRAFVEEQRETLQNCSDEQEARVAEALGG